MQLARKDGEKKANVDLQVGWRCRKIRIQNETNPAFFSYGLVDDEETQLEDMFMRVKPEKSFSVKDWWGSLACAL